MMTECYECSRLAELVAENSQLRVKCDEHDEAERDWERKFNEAMGEEYEMRQQLVKELDELRAGEWAKADNAIRELSEENDELRVERDALVDALGATDAIEWSQEQLENANPALVNALKAHDTREKPWNERVDDYLATFDDSREKLEADALELVDNLRMYGGKYAGDAEVEIIGMLDRQAAITERETRRIAEPYERAAANHIEELQAKMEEYEKTDTRIDYAERIAFVSREKNLQGTTEELQADYDELVAKCAELCALCGFSMVDASGEVVG